MRTKSRAGFTMVELMVALTAGAILLAALYGLVAAVVDSGSRLVAQRREAEQLRQGDRWLRSVIASTSVGRPGDAQYEGRPEAASFTSMVPTAYGWHEARAVSLSLRGDSLLLAVTGSEDVVLRQGVQDLALDYLLEPGANAKWVRQWHSPVSAPLAVRVRIDTGADVDTALYLIGPRG